MTRTVEYRVVGDILMGCSACEQRVKRALLQLPGVQTVQANAKNQLIVITIQSEQANLEQVQARLEQMGYEVLPAGDDQ